MTRERAGYETSSRPRRGGATPSRRRSRGCTPSFKMAFHISPKAAPDEVDLHGLVKPKGPIVPTCDANRGRRENDHEDPEMAPGKRRIVKATESKGLRR